jgi:ABC-type antimicrobial peptide transport system permease subunit
MKIPFKYNLRGLGRRKVRTALTVFGIAFVTVVTVIMSALVHSMWSSIKNNGSPDNIILLSKKAQNAVFSEIKEEAVGRLSDLENLKKHETGFPLISPEIVTGIGFRVKGYEGLKRGVVRGVDPDGDLAYLVNDTVVLDRYSGVVDGEKVDWSVAGDGTATLTVAGPDGRNTFTAPDLETFRRKYADPYAVYVESAAPSSDGEIIVGRMAFVKMGIPKDELAVGRKLSFGETDWTVVGSFVSPGTSFESEIWAHVEDMKVFLNRRTFSQITVKVTDPSKVDSVLEAIRGREDVKLNAQAEQEFYAAYSANFNLFRSLVIVIAVIMAVGGIFAGMNTMYASVMGRIREIGTLKVLGFPKKSIFVSITVESVCIAFVGGVLGSACAFGLSNVLSVPGGLGIPIKISMNAFLIRVELIDVAYGLAAATFIGLAGAVLPAFKGIRMPIVNALRWT